MLSWGLYHYFQTIPKNTKFDAFQRRSRRAAFPLSTMISSSLPWVTTRSEGWYVMGNLRYIPLPGVSKDKGQTRWSSTRRNLRNGFQDRILSWETHSVHKESSIRIQKFVTALKVDETAHVASGLGWVHTLVLSNFTIILIESEHPTITKCCTSN